MTAVIFTFFVNCIINELLDMKKVALKVDEKFLGGFDFLNPYGFTSYIIGITKPPSLLSLSGSGGEHSFTYTVPKLCLKMSGMVPFLVECFA